MLKVFAGLYRTLLSEVSNRAIEVSSSLSRDTVLGELKVHKSSLILAIAILASLSDLNGRKNNEVVASAIQYFPELELESERNSGIKNTG